MGKKTNCTINATGKTGQLTCKRIKLDYSLILSSTLASSCKELTHWKRLWCWEGLGAGGGGDDRGWDGWMSSLTRWTWVWVNSRCWWWTGSPGVLRFMGLQRVGHNWVTELNWRFYCILFHSFCSIWSRRNSFWWPSNGELLMSCLHYLPEDKYDSTVNSIVKPPS